MPLSMAAACLQKTATSTVDLRRSSIRFAISALPYSARGNHKSGKAVLSSNNQVMTVTIEEGACGFTYFASYDSNWSPIWDVQYDDDHPVIGPHLVPVSFVEQEISFTGQCITAIGVSDGGPIIPLRDDVMTALTLDYCLDRCKNFEYTILGDGQNCFCSETIPIIELLPDAECNKPCTGDPSNNKCGGYYKWSVYNNYTPEPFTGQCLQDYSDVRVFDDVAVGYFDLTVEACLERCEDYKYAAVQNGLTCRCGNEFGRETEILANSACDMPCKGDQTQTCGGWYKQNIYTV